MTSSDGWELTVDECLAKKVDLEKYESPSAFAQRVACELLTSEQKDETVKSAIRKQIWTDWLSFFRIRDLDD